MESSTSPRKTSPEAASSKIVGLSSRPRLAVGRRVRVMGKFLYLGDEKFDVKGVTYGPFRPGEDGCEYGDPARVESDFAGIVATGCNAVRVYTVPPTWFLNLAQSAELRVMVGLPWEQHVTFLEDRSAMRRILQSVREGVRSCAGHPAILCFTVGNEVPAGVVRYLGPTAVEQFLKRLINVVRSEDPGSLVTYVSYPTTEYLRVPSVDFVTFNVYLESQEKTAGYIARLQNLAGELPLVLAEVGLDSLRNGQAKQAEILAWQIKTTFQGGCAGTFVFAWTDEWFRGGQEIEDWAFGLVTRDREPKPALAAVEKALAEPLLPDGKRWPFISVVVCTYNGAATIRETFEALSRLDYENFEVVVIDDGCTDGTKEIAQEYENRLICVENGGLSRARNLGMEAAEGEIVAYIDDDAYPDPHWLSFLAIGFMTSEHVGVGGPNLAPHDDGHVADCVANSPGGPSHVLYTDHLAEHLPGCNMAFRREAILAIDGFDERFRIAGDDVDLCWRLIEKGGTLGFHAGAVVWHHRRNRVATYLKQQRNYGRAEAMLEQKWPEKYNRVGHLRWAGKLYGKGHTVPLASKSQTVSYGVWGSRLFQSMYSNDFDSAWYITLMPEWYLLSGCLAGMSALGFLWAPLFWCLPLLVVAVLVPLVQVLRSAAKARFVSAAVDRSRSLAWKLYSITAGLHILQPLVRLIGRLSYRLTPWRAHGVPGFVLPVTSRYSHWSESWFSQEDWLLTLERTLQSHRVLVRRGGDRDRWDLQAACGLFGGARLLSAVEEHGSGKQMVRIRVWPRVAVSAVVLCSLFLTLAILAATDAAWLASAILGGVTSLFLYRCIRECGAAIKSVRTAVTSGLSTIEKS
jgi:glycosyltransferase involved in cell wall biosynthesis